MRLSNKREDLEQLRSIIELHYKRHGRFFSLLTLSPEEDQSNAGSYSWTLLLDRTNVIRYSIGPSDRGHGFLGGVSLAIGPYFFHPADFWSYEASERFRMGTEPHDIEFNLKLLDEFLGFKHTPPK